MNNRKAWISLVVLAAAAALMSLAIACGSDNDDDGGANATPTEAGQTPSETMDDMPAETVHIQMLEFSITGEDGAEITGLTAGTVVFEAHNDGTVPHSFIVIKTDTDADSLPVSANAVDESAAGDKIGDTGEIPNGEIEMLSVDLEPGKYALICNIIGHYEQGMYAQIVIP